MTDKLGLAPGEIRELRIGDSFSDKKVAFHTLRYDFKPASVVSASKNASMEVFEKNHVTVTHLETAGAPQTVFKGAKLPYKKECVLVIDRKNGTITLEKLSSNIFLKKTRQESRPSNYNSSTRPPTPVEKKPSPPQSTRNYKSKTFNTTSLRHSPLQKSPSYPHRSPHNFHKSPPQVHNTSSSPSLYLGLPMIDDLNENSSGSVDITTTLNLPALKTLPDFSGGNFNDDEVSPEVGLLSSTSSTSSSDSSSSGSSDSESEPENEAPAKPINGHVNGKSSLPLLQSMPDDFLTEDLQLSESSDSDSD